jgi:hypothetical protein
MMPMMRTWKINDVRTAADLMRRGRPLVQMHKRNGVGWYMVPGGELTERVALTLFERPDVQPSGDGLFAVFHKLSK